MMVYVNALSYLLTDEAIDHYTGGVTHMEAAPLDPIGG